MSKTGIHGVFPALLTPFTKGGAKVDYDRACALALRLAKQGVHGVFVCGTTGEGPLMSLAERKQLLEEVVGAAGKRIKVIAHTGCFDTASTIELTQHAAKVGAAAAGVVTPGFYTFDDESLYRHFKSVADSAQGFPVLLYNIPGCVKNVIKPALVIRLANTVDNIVGMKDSGGSIASFNEVLLGAPSGFAAINGVDEYSMQALVAGGSGCVSSTANVVPELFLAIYNAVRKGDLKKAWQAQEKLCRACALFHYGALVARYKEGLRLRGFDPGYVRPPQRELTADERKEFSANMKKSGLI